ncbi:MAG: class I SAM-dependent methyltransferase [Actinomycetota bacterium]
MRGPAPTGPTGSDEEVQFREHSRLQREYFEQAEQRTLKPTGSAYLRRHVDRMMEFARIGPGDRVLEVGAGMGRYTLILAERGVGVEAMDLSAQLLETIRGESEGRIPVHALDIVEAPADMHGRFDAVVGFFVLHHVHDVEACLSMASRLVRPGGRVAFIEPNPSNPLYYVQIFLTPEMRWSSEKGLLRMKPQLLFPWMERAGLVDTDLRRFGFFPPFVTNLPFGVPLERAFERVPLWRPGLPFQLFGGERP